MLNSSGFGLAVKHRHPNVSCMARMKRPSLPLSSKIVLKPSRNDRQIVWFSVCRIFNVMGLSYVGLAVGNARGHAVGAPSLANGRDEWQSGANSDGCLAQRAQIQSPPPRGRNRQ